MPIESTIDTANPICIPRSSPKRSRRRPPRGGASTIGTRLRMDCSVNPTTRPEPASSSPTSENVAGNPSDAHAITKKSPTKTAAGEAHRNNTRKPAVVSPPKSSRALRVPSRSERTPPGYA